MSLLDFGVVHPGTLLVIPFATYDSNDPAASVTITGLATSDIEVYKDGSNTARTSDSGYALLGGDGVDEFGTGIHGVSISLADNTQAGFYASGSQYFATIASITVDAGVVNAITATWRIGYEDAVLNTTINGAPGSQTEFVLLTGPAENDALNGCVVLIHDVASAVQLSFAIILDYVGATKTVTLVVAPTFTIATTDNVAVYPQINVHNIGVLATAQVNAEVVDALTVDTYAEPGQGTPPATLSIVDRGRYMFKWIRNKMDNDGANINMYADDGTTVDQKRTIAQAGGVTTKGEIVTGL